MRELYALESRRGFPGTLLRIGDSTGALLFLELTTSPVVQVAALQLDDVADLHETLGEWLRERTAHPSPAPAPLVAGVIARGLADAGTVQSRTVHASDQGVSQVAPAVLPPTAM
jgi:hypothetical protein